MNDIDRQDYIDRYEQRLQQFGYSPEALGWGKYGRQEIRFSILTAEALANAGCSVLDVGCGFADLYHFLQHRGWSGYYTGVDIVPGLLEIGKQRAPGLDLRLLDITESTNGLDHYDYVIASGVINAKLAVGDNKDHIIRLVGAMSRLARRAACIDFLNTYVDFEKPELWHTDVVWMIDAARRFSRRYSLRCDYMPYESAIFIYPDARINSERVFAGFLEKINLSGMECPGVQRAPSSISALST